MAGRETELLVVGSGVAGCAAALAGARAGVEVTLATKATRPEDTTSYWAQGGVAVARGDPGAFKEDVLDASDGTADPEAVNVLVENADDAVRDVLIDTLGVRFDERDGDDVGVEQAFDYCREAAHSEPRILHVDASTGRHVLAPFLNHLDGHDSVEVLEDTAALDLITHEGRVHGAVLERDGDWAACVAGATVLATGGIGACYDRTTNPATATGDGIAMAALAGAAVDDMEYVQFHPTAFAGGNDAAGTDAAGNDGGGHDRDGNDEGGGEAGDRRGTFLLSEAVRGAGARLDNADGERFMPDYHADAELGPRDVVARAVRDERERTGSVHLDVSPIDFEGEFPDLHAACERRGVDPAEGIPVAPAEHFLCGGVDVDTEGRTSLDRLFAVGECARTGVHGANRLGSTSLLEALVWGLRAGEAAASFEPQPGRVEAPDMRDSDPDLPEGFAGEKFVRLRRVMDEYVGLERTPGELRRAASVLRRLKGEVDAYTRTRTSRSLYELRGACISALLVARAAAENDRSRGCHHLAEVADADAD